MFKSIVSIVKGTDTEKLVDEALSLLGGVDSLIKPDSIVVVKPNAGHPFPPETSDNGVSGGKRDTEGSGGCWCRQNHRYQGGERPNKPSNP